MATVQKAFKVLQDAGLLEGLRGRGTSVAGSPHAGLEAAPPLRQAGLVHRADTFLLQALTAGHTIGEMEAAFRVALDRWRAVTASEAIAPDHVIRFVGSHDVAVAWLASRFPELAPGHRLDVSFTGSLGGLIALAEGKADIAGSHLLNEESGCHNDDCSVGFVNRQKGSGTRVWLDVELRRMGWMASESRDTSEKWQPTRQWLPGSPTGGRRQGWVWRGRPRCTDWVSCL